MAADRFHFRDRAVYLPAADALVLADLHLGRDATSNVELPLGERRELESRLSGLVEAFDPAEVVFAGDVFHAFSSVPDGVADAFAALREAVEGAGSALTVVEGNHDAMLGSITETAAEHGLADGTVVCHGHEAPDEGADRYVIGHEHPAIVIERRRRPCYLLGEDAYRDADVLVLPAFNRLPPGTAVNRLRDDDLASPLLERFGAFRPIVRDEDAAETFTFPPLASLREFL